MSESHSDRLGARQRGQERLVLHKGLVVDEREKIEKLRTRSLVSLGL